MIWRNMQTEKRVIRLSRVMFSSNMPTSQQAMQ